MSNSIYDPRYLDNIPEDAVKAAITLEKWAATNGHKDWMLAGVASRGYAMRLEDQLKSAHGVIEAAREMCKQDVNKLNRGKLFDALEAFDQASKSCE